jgi:WD40 repeat protein
VTSLSLNAYGILFSSSGDGSVKKWNLASRKVAFSFENRNSSVTALAISDDLLVVGLKNGIINYFSIDNAILANTSSFHKKSITSLVSYDGEVYSSSLDGFIFKQSTRLRIARNLHINAEQRDVRSLMIFKSQLFAIRGASEIFSFQIDRNGVVNTLINSTEPLLCIEVSDTLFIAGAKSGLILVWELETLTFRYYLRGHTSQVNSLLVHDDFLFSASSDKTIIKWSLEKRIIDLVLKRFSASALGHLGPVNYLAFCHGALFSAGADTAVRRWNVENGKHHDVYFGFSKSVTTVLCFNKSVIAGSEDSSVLLFRPIFAEETISTSTSLKSQRQTKPGKIIRKVQQNLDGGTMSPLNQTYLIIGAAVLLLVILALTTIIKWRSLRREKASPVIEDSSKSSTLYPTDLKTVVNSVMGISKHAAYLIDNAAVVKVKKIATGEAELCTSLKLWILN